MNHGIQVRVGLSCTDLRRVWILKVKKIIEFSTLKIDIEYVYC